ncbi:MAG: glycosyltransferase [Bacteriovoracaceae bacterium]|nr:glycosyltransferase [Bacteriovoracaceae bacterium]
MEQNIRRILMTADIFGGVWTYTLDLAREFQKLNIHVGIAALGGTLDREQRREVFSIPDIDVFESRFPLEWMNEPWSALEAGREWISKLEENFAPDIIHLNSFCHRPVDPGCLQVIVAHSDVFSWYSAVLNKKPPPKWNRYYEEVQKSLNAVDLVIAPSKAALRDLENQFGPLPNEKLSIPNGCREIEEINVLKKNRILSVGRLWDEAKNISALDKIAEQIPWPILVAGSAESPMGEEVILNHVFQLGHLPKDQLHYELARASIYVAPAKYEPFGLGILEAALNGCALVLGDIPSLRENWDGACVFVDSNRPEEIKHALLDFISDPAKRKKFASLSQSRAQEFTSKKMAGSYLDAYGSLLKKYGRASVSREAACAF